MEEEIGLDVSHLIRADHFIEAVYGEQRTRLYIVPGLPEDTPMLTQTRKEISDIAWVRIQVRRRARRRRGAPAATAAAR